MASERCNRLVVGSFNLVGKVIVVAACLMWLITLADLSLDLGWGWDRQGVWLGPIIIVMGVAVLMGGNAIFRLLGGASAK